VYYLRFVPILFTYCSPIFERRGLYQLAVHSFRLLVFGLFPREKATDSTDLLEQLIQQQRTCTYPPWISRRARGKAMERLVVDCCQIHRRDNNNSKSDATAEKFTTKTKKASNDKFRQSLDQFCKDVIATTSVSSSIGLSAIRTLARRLKQPLDKSLNPFRCIESNELGIRLSNSTVSEEQRSSDKTVYTDWTPKTDYFVAHSINRENNESGTRCTFVGFEDEIDHSILSSSLNVEELALELYKSGRLPCSHDDISKLDIQGGWIGWHNEGGIVRALFRIICGAPLLHMDFRDNASSKSREDMLQNATIHLSPYQQGPFHLLVGYELQKVRVNSTNHDDSFYIPSPSFYCHHADEVSYFLNTLSTLNGQALADVVYDAVASRLKYICLNQLKDPFLELDIVQVRTLSALAAGFGGQCLAAMFRCLLFDYRHYSGGLPDLHLFRAVCNCKSTPLSSHTLVDLGDWIGESFSKDNQQLSKFQLALHILSDDEFLGLDKPSNSRLGRHYSSRFPTDSTVNIAQSNVFSLGMLPERLQFTNNDIIVTVECLMVEVKSSNE
jgi:hypothetical protein